LVARLIFLIDWQPAASLFFIQKKFNKKVCYNMSKRLQYSEGHLYTKENLSWKHLF
jgi:hypothetical protein